MPGTEQQTKKEKKTANIQEIRMQPHIQRIQLKRMIFPMTLVKDDFQNHAIISANHVSGQSRNQTLTRTAFMLRSLGHN